MMVLKKNDFSVAKISGVIVLLVMMFPWVSFNILQADTQPWYIIISAGYVFFCWRKKLPLIVISGYSLPLIALLVGIYYIESFGRLSYRAIFSYFGLAVSVHAYYLYRKYYAENILGVIKFANYIWLFAGLMQVVFGKYVFGFLVAARTTYDRGVTSLAPEPTYFAVVLVFLSWLIWIESGYRLTHGARLLIIINVISVVVLAKSAMGVVFILLFLSVYLMTYALSKKAMYLILFLMPLLFVSSGENYYVEEESRVSKIYDKMKNDPLHIIEEDASINSRVAHVAIPLYGVLSDYGKPHGYNVYAEQAESLVNYFDGIFWYGYGGDKIMSALASSLYELGWFSVALVMYVVMLLRNTINIRHAFINTVIMFAYLMAAIPIAFPMTGMILAASYINYRNKRIYA